MPHATTVDLRLDCPMLLRVTCPIGGAEWPGEGTFAVSNPADGSVIAQVPDLGPDAVEAAIDAAAAAMPAWAAWPARERGAVLRRWARLIEQHAGDLACMLTAEQGKPLREARAELASAAAFFRWFAEEAQRAYGEVIPFDVPGRRLITIREPVGICAAITPWNFPASMVARKLAPALAAGCAVILKPAEATPLSALALAWLGREAGLPAGLLSVVTAADPQAVGQAMTDSPRIAKLSFTGSTATGRKLVAACAPTLKRTSMELGGNAAFIVFEDADLDAAVEGAIAAKFRNAGQTCICSNRLFVQRSIHDRFVAALVSAAGNLRVGPGSAEDVDVGPVINEPAVAKVSSMIEDARSLGASVVLGGGRHSLGGTYFAPTVLAGATSAMRIAHEEIFGPVAPVFPFNDEADVLQQANATEYGLAAYVYTRDIGRAWRMAERLETGMVAVNAGLFSTEVAPFGGIKQSGHGREGSRHGLSDYLNIKFVAFGGI